MANPAYPTSTAETMTCGYCKRNADEMPGLVLECEDQNIHPNDWIVANDPTFNALTNSFACDDCYVALGMPSLPWVAGQKIR